MPSSQNVLGLLTATMLLGPSSLCAAQDKAASWTIELGKLKAPATAWPDEKFRVSLNVDGGPANEEFDANLEAVRVADRDGKATSGDKKFTTSQRGKFDKRSRSIVEFEIDVGAVQQAKATDKNGLSKLEGTWEVSVKVPRHARENFDKPFHESQTVKVLVQHKKLRVLLFSEGRTREFQFVRTLFDRYPRQFETFIYSKGTDNEFDVDPERVLKQFPSYLGPEEDGKKGKSLSSFDLIIAIDPFWEDLKVDQTQMLERWVSREGGGVIFVAGPRNTYQLSIRTPATVPIHNILPVVLKDARLAAEDDVDRAFPLKFTAQARNLSFLQFDEKTAGSWDHFFWGDARKPKDEDQEPVHGMFGCYPVKRIRPEATVLANFGRPKSRREKIEQPYLVSMPYGNGRSFYIGSGETWRLRQYKEAAFEHFWIKLARHVAVDNFQPKGAVQKPIQVLVIDGDPIREKKGDKNDAYWVKAALDAIPTQPYDVVLGHELTGGQAAKALERDDLAKFGTILLLNVRDLKDKQLRNLEKYAEGGGGVGFFLGPKVASDYYNEKLYKEGKGLFPVPLGETYYPSKNENMIKREFDDTDMLVLRFDLFPKVDRYPVFGPIFGDAGVREFLKDMPVGRWFKVPREQWKPDPTRSFELASLPNDQPVESFAGAMRSTFYNQDVKAILLDKANAKFAASLEKHRNNVTVLVAAESKKKPYHLARAIDRMLSDRGKASDDERPDLREFWASKDEKIQKFRREATALLNKARYGDPLVVVGNFGKGRVLAVLTTAGPEWNEWALGFMYQPFIWESVNFLALPKAKEKAQIDTPERALAQMLKEIADREQAEATRMRNAFMSLQGGLSNFHLR